jgi:quercetin dioxygenase-like cupin family protein
VVANDQEVQHAVIPEDLRWRATVTRARQCLLVRDLTLASAPAEWLVMAKEALKMPVVLHAEVPCESVPGGATYQTLVGDSQGSTAIRIGIQTSPPGYRTLLHSHPYMQAITVLEGRGEAWMQDFDRLIALTPGVTLVIPANVQHWFRASGSEPLKVYGVHASPHCIVHLYQEVGDDGASELPDNPHRVSRLPNVG